MMRRLAIPLAALLASCTNGPFFSSSLPGSCSAQSPNCGPGGSCDTTRGICVEATDVSVKIPAEGDLTGGPQATFNAHAVAPPAPTKVDIRIEQPLGTVKETETVTTGDSNNVYSVTMQLGAHGLVSGPAVVFATVHWGTGDKTQDSPPVHVTLDMSGPVISAFTSGGPYSSSAPAANATVTATIVDSASGVLATSVKLTCLTHTYSGTAGAANVWTFSVPVGDLGVADGSFADVSCTVNATDKLLNVGTALSGAIHVVDTKAPVIGTVTVTANSAAGSNGFYSRATNVTVPVDVTADDGAGGSGAASVTLAINGHSYPPASSAAGTGTARVFHFNVPTAEAANANTEGFFAFTLNASDAAGNASGALSNAAWKLAIDDLGPVAGAVVVNGGFTAAGGTHWFAQGSATDIDIQADIIDNGSGVLLSSLHLLKTGTTTPIDHAVVADSVTAHRYHFMVAPSTAGAAGVESVVTFQVYSTDGLAHLQQDDSVTSQVSTGGVGIDGHLPSVGTPVDDRPIYTSSGAVAFQTASVTVALSDLGSGVGAPSLAATGVGGLHNYSPTSGSGNGNYVFTVPAGDLLAADAGVVSSVAFNLFVPDNVGNLGGGSGHIVVDNAPPTFDGGVAPATFIAADGGVQVSIIPLDQSNGAGVDPTTVQAQFSAQTFNLTAGSGGTFAGTIPGTVQTANTQGAVSFVFAAKDAVGNAGQSSSFAVNVDRKPPAIVAVSVTPGPGNGFYSRGASVPLTVTVDDTTGSGETSGTAGVSLAMANSASCAAPCTQTSSAAGTGTSRVFSFTVPGNVQTSGSGTPLGFTVTATDAVGNPATDTTHTLPIDDAKPTITNVVVNVGPSDFTDSNGVNWFQQSGGGTIDVQADINDVGSGVKQSTIAVVITGASGSPFGGATKDIDTVNHPNTYHVQIPRNVSTVGTNQTGPVSFQFTAQDSVGNGSDTAQPSSQGTFSIDGTPPIAGTATPGVAYYSPSAAPGTPAAVTASITDTGGSGVKLAEVKLTNNGHTHAATGVVGSTYSWSLPMSDFPSTGTQTYSLTVNAKDNVLNIAAANSTGSLLIDNDPPTFATFGGLSGTAPFNCASAIGANETITDPSSGSGVNNSTVKIKVGATLISTSGPPSANVYPWSLHGSDFQANNTQGTINYNFVASDNAGNATLLSATNSAQSVSVDCKAPTVGTVTVTNSSITNANGYYPRDTSTIPVTAVVSDTDLNGSGAASATLTPANNGAGGCSAPCGVPVTSTSVASGTQPTITYQFSIPVNIQTPGTEGQLSFNITGADLAGNTHTATAVGVLKIDDKGPTIDPAQITLATVGDATVSGTTWFKQSTGGNIEVDAIIVDNGSGVNGSTVTLTATATGTGNGVVHITGTPTGVTNQYKFLIPRDGGSGVLTGPVGTGKEGAVTLSIGASDNVGNAATPAGPSGFSVGIDGKAPSPSFVITTQYPSGCDNSAGGLTTSITCGHDGSRFWRTGDDGNTLFFTATDSGSGTAATGATCAMNGQSTCTVAYNTGNGHYEFAISPSQATDFTSDANGRGTATVTITVQDAVGNTSSSTQQTMNITRFKWARTLPIGKIKGSPIVTPAISGNRLLLVGGDGTGGSTTTVAALNTQGGVLSGAAIGGSITTNMAYSPTTKILYSVAEGTQKMVAFGVGTSGLSTGFTCDLGTGKTINGSPAIITNTITSLSTEFTLLAESTNHKLYAATGTIGGSCDFAGTVTPVIIGTGTVKSPSTDGASVYVIYQGTGFAKVPLSNGAFGTVVTKDVSFNSPFGNAAIVGSSLFMADLKNYQAYPTDFTGTVTGIWTTPTTNGRMGDNITSVPVVNNSLVYGVAGSNDGSLRVFNSADGTPAFTASTAATYSQVALGADATTVLYFTDASGSLQAMVRSSSTVAQAPRWTAAFTGAVGGVTFTGAGSEPTLASDGTLYFGADNGAVYAIATDSPGGVTPTGASNWPRAGFDNCNSNNNSLTNCH